MEKEREGRRRKGREGGGGFEEKGIRRGWKGRGGGEEREEKVEGGLRRREVGEGGGRLEEEKQKEGKVHLYIRMYVSMYTGGGEERKKEDGWERGKKIEGEDKCGWSGKRVREEGKRGKGGQKDNQLKRTSK